MVPSRLLLLALALALPRANAQLAEGDLGPSGRPVWGVPLGTEQGPALAAKVRLGRHLFYDTRLSGNGCYSCASCHVQERAFTDGRATAIGATGGGLPRNTPTLTNVGYNASFTWIDAHVESLEAQAVRPLLAQDPVEMGLIDEGRTVLRAFKADRAYRSMFEEAFPDSQERFSLRSIVSTSVDRTCATSQSSETS